MGTLPVSQFYRMKMSREIHTTIREAETVKLEIEEQKPKTNQWWITIVFFVVLALLLVIIWLYLRMKHYQKMRA